jgi:glycosidase
MVWLTPFYVNQPGGYHGYHAENYNHVDPRFAYGENIIDNNKGDVFDPNDINVETGADLVLKELIEECHKRNLKIMMDFVPNHVYMTHPYFQDAEKNENSKYRDWFYFIKKEEKKEEVHKSSKKGKKGKKKDNDEELLSKKKKREEVRHLAFLGFSDLPKLNLTNKDVQTHLINSTEKFLKYGIDAVRIDHCIGPDFQSLKNIINKIHESFPQVPFIGEILPFGISDNSETILGITEQDLKKLDKVNLDSIKYLDEVILKYVGCLDGALDFSFQYYVDMFVKGEIDEKKCNEEIIEHFKRFEKEKNFILLKNIDSHDSDRIMFRCKNNYLLFQKAMNLLYKNWEERNDPIVLYYGTEDFMNQEKTIYGEPYGDFRCRQPMYFTNCWINQLFKNN